MYHLSDRIRELEEMVETIVGRYKALEKDHKQLRTEYFRIIETINQQKTLIEKLESGKETKQEYQTLDKKREDHIKTKQIINEMMREIDHCLLLLDR